MMKQKKRKTNPRRIPLAKRDINKDAILEEATKDDLYHAWLLVFNALIEQERITYDEMPALTDCVNRYIQEPKNESLKREESTRAEKLMGIPRPYLNLNVDAIRSAVELEAFKRKVQKVAIHTALGVLCLGLESSKRFSENDLRDIFFNVDLSLAEVERGLVSYKALENRLAAYGVLVERESDDLHHARICDPETQRSDGR